MRLCQSLGQHRYRICIQITIYSPVDNNGENFQITKYRGDQGVKKYSNPKYNLSTWYSKFYPRAMIYTAKSRRPILLTKAEIQPENSQKLLYLAPVNVEAGGRETCLSIWQSYKQNYS